MRCDQVERALSASMDEPLGRPVPPSVRAHADTCPRCRAFESSSWRIRKTVRFEAAPPVPDLAPAIMEGITAERARTLGRPLRTRARRRLVSAWRPDRSQSSLRRVVAVGLAAGVLVGFLVTGGLPRSGQETAALAAQIPQRLVAAAVGLRGYRATFDVVERHWAPAVPVRTFVAHVAFRAPESFRVVVRDTTPYPPGSWTRNDLSLVTNGRSWVATGAEPCPDGVPPPCAGGPVAVQRVGHRPPFDQSTAMPTDVIVPMTVLAAADRVHVLGPGDVAGRDAVAIDLAYQDATPLFDYLRFLGAWRPFFPQDRVVVWLDRATWFPLSYEVLPAPGPERARWAEQVGVGKERPGHPVFRATVRHGRFSTAPPPRSEFAPLSARLPESVGRPSLLDEGFVTSSSPPGGQPTNTPIPGFTAGLRPGRFGELPRTPLRPYREAVASYVNGLAWITVARVSGWNERRPFGVGPFAQPMALAGGRPALYEPATSASARRMAIHTPDGEILVSTNLPLADLRRVASSLPVQALPEPVAWRIRPWAGGHVEDGLSPGDALTRAGFRALVPSWLPPGYRSAAAEVVRTSRVRGVTLVFRRPAAELDGVGLRLYQARGQSMPPPAGEEQAVSVGSVTGRWSPEDHQVEWVSDGVYRSLTGPAFELSTLLRVADSLRTPGVRA